MNLQKLRAALKPLGYGFTTKRLSWGRHVTYRHNESGAMLNGNVFTAETIQQWDPLFTFLKENDEQLKAVSENEGEKIYGLTFDLSMETII
jgi:hypothetical protein